MKPWLEQANTERAVTAAAANARLALELLWLHSGEMSERERLVLVTRARWHQESWAAIGARLGLGKNQVCRCWRHVLEQFAPERLGHSDINALTTTGRITS